MSRFGREKVPGFVHDFFKELFCNSPVYRKIYSTSATAISLTLVPVGPVRIRPSTARRVW